MHNGKNTQYNIYINSFSLIKMKQTLRSLMTFFQHRMLTKVQSDQAYSQITRKKTIKSQFIKYVRSVVMKLVGLLAPWNNMDTTTKMYNIGLTLIILAIAYLIFIKHYKKPHPRSPKKHSFSNLGQNNKLPKRTSSLLSIKQFQSHSDNSGIQSDIEQLKPKQVRKMTKQYKQYCTDIETEPQNGHYDTVMQSKRDKFFFNLIGSYQSTAKDTGKGANKSGELGDLLNYKDNQSDYQCEYEGQNQMSPPKNQKYNRQQKQCKKQQKYNLKVILPQRSKQVKIKAQLIKSSSPRQQ